ncbi:MAG: response regulator transcription factor [Anaeromicrobium sp.]|jgi:DNA-binding response OmpR family regulator|uniref:response regulator transcription factor n=1 Tax=Anaeromicrobium sp. TaxID=1929132 RepID=UPI0025E3E201|nr:response regulator transcription factor [Anaeromicrobium sp.]MCT4593269.1 response regulator transcription factor [Anaeromicrobium sp.]
MEIKILVVDDEENITDTIAYALKREQYTVYTAYDGKEALDKIQKFHPDILILDVMMPKLSGYDVCKKIGYNTNMGIIMLTAKNDLVDKVLGLELGADDYMTKPFDLLELLARVRSLSRRIKKAQSDMEKNYDDEILKVYEIKICLKERVVYIEDEIIDFKPKEFDLLAFLVKNKERTFSRYEILDRVWGQDYFGGTRTIDIHIQRIRKKLGKYSEILKTMPKIGYKAVGKIYEK